jgi:hypothetical protein
MYSFPLTASGAISFYVELLSSKQFAISAATKSATASCIAAGGDLACQISSDQQQVNLLRTGRMAAWAMMTTPLVCRWYSLLYSRFPNSAFRRMAADQLLWAPPATFAMLGFIGAAEGAATVGGLGTVQENARARIVSAYVPTLRANYLVWPAVQYINFAMIPPKFQILFSNLIGLGWSFYLSHLANAPAAAAPRAAAPAALPHAAAATASSTTRESTKME